MGGPEVCRARQSRANRRVRAIDSLRADVPPSTPSPGAGRRCDTGSPCRRSAGLAPSRPVGTGCSRYGGDDHALDVTCLAPRASRRGRLGPLDFVSRGRSAAGRALDREDRAARAPRGRRGGRGRGSRSGPAAAGDTATGCRPGRDAAGRCAHGRTTRHAPGAQPGRDGPRHSDSSRSNGPGSPPGTGGRGPTAGDRRHCDRETCAGDTARRNGRVRTGGRRHAQRARGRSPAGHAGCGAAHAGRRADRTVADALTASAAAPVRPGRRAAHRPAAGSTASRPYPCGPGFSAASPCAGSAPEASRGGRENPSTAS